MKGMVIIAKENVRKFYRELIENKELQKKMAKAQESYNGDLNDRQTIVETVFLPIAKEAGFDFTAEELKAAEREVAEIKGISEEELENVSGGAGGCLGIGFGNDCSQGYTGWVVAHLCAYIGIGIDIW